MALAAAMARSARLPVLQCWRALPTAIAVAKVDHSDTALVPRVPEHNLYKLDKQTIRG